jgi:hypothetical protein
MQSGARTMSPQARGRVRVIMIVDRSVSMADHKERVVDAIRRFILALQNSPATAPGDRW